jgi:hypothetical protein
MITDNLKIDKSSERLDIVKNPASHKDLTGEDSPVTEVDPSFQRKQE